MSVFTLDPNVEQFLIADQGEFIVDEVRKHWAAVFVPILELLAIIPVLLLMRFLPSGAYWVPLLGALFLLVNALWRMLGIRMDRFVVTNMRVFRVHGILSQHVATMPISRILDISVHTPIIGRIFNYGHFVFESAAQEQGLREIRYVGSPTKRGLTIQRVIQASGLRGSGAMRPRSTEAAMSQRSTQPVQPVAPTQPGESTQTAPIDLPWWRSDM